MTFSYFSNTNALKLFCALATVVVASQNSFGQQNYEAIPLSGYPRAGESVVNQRPTPARQDNTPTAGVFLPPNVSPRAGSSFGNGMTGVSPKSESPSQIQNYLKPLPESVFDQTTNGNVSPDEKEVTETTGRLELIVENYENGQPRIRRYVAQDNKGNYYNQGKWQLLGKRQEVTAEGEFDRGRMNGQWKRLHNKTEGGMFATKPFTNFEGPYRSYAEFNNGKLDGVWKITDRFEQVIFEMPYSDGIRNGTASWYHPNSEKMLEITFKKGIIDGMLFEWDEQREIVRQEEYIEGRKVVKDTQFFAKDKPLSQNFFLDGKLAVDGEDDWWKANPAGYASVGQRIQHGPTGTWYQNGQPQMRGQFVEGRRQGVFVGWHSNGQKDVVGRFKDDIRVGKWTWWHSNGFKSVEGQFEDGIQVGEWIWWNDDGTVKRRRDLSQERSVMETNDRRESDEPSDAIIEAEGPDIDPKRDQPEEIESQELPAKKNAPGNEGDNDETPEEVIPLHADAPEATSEAPEAVSGEVENSSNGETADDNQADESDAEEIETLPDDALKTGPTSGATTEPISDPFGDQKSD